MLDFKRYEHMKIYAHVRRMNEERLTKKKFISIYMIFIRLEEEKKNLKIRRCRK
jgi:hypothetical protein